MIQSYLSTLVQGRSLSSGEMTEAMTEIMTGQASDAQIGAFLVALRIKGETVEELAAAANVMRSLSTKVIIGDRAIDTCGTGGDGANLFNVSTAAAFVVAAAGGRVAKHGNRSVSSSTGSADVLESMGMSLDLNPEQIGRAIDEVGLGFMFAPAHHSAMKHAIGPRRELAMRTMFNILGPMTNPAGVKHQVLGVFSPDLCVTVAKVLRSLGSERVLVVSAEDGLDEFSLASITHVAELVDGDIRQYTVAPEDVGLEVSDMGSLKVSSPGQSFELISDVFNRGSSSVTRLASDMVAFNAGAAIYTLGITSTLSQGVAMAEDVIATGLPAAKVADLVEFSRCCSSINVTEQ